MIDVTTARATRNPTSASRPIGVGSREPERPNPPFQYPTWRVQLGAMETILGWPPILWVSRALALLVLSGAFVLVSGLLIRLLRPESFRGLVAGDVPLRGLRDKLTLLGQEFEADVDLDSRRDEQLTALERRLENLIDVVYEHGIALKAMLVRRTEGGNGEKQ